MKKLAVLGFAVGSAMLAAGCGEAEDRSAANKPTFLKADTGPTPEPKEKEPREKPTPEPQDPRDGSTKSERDAKEKGRPCQATGDC